MTELTKSIYGIKARIGSDLMWPRIWTGRDVV